ncbi:MAG: DUF1638 domain-containing protein [Anaerolineaceae bacterium]|nr:DUF1638 domain-containing protein [Anaerolineaceae bacterium]
MKLKCIGCEALARILYHCAATSPHLIDMELFELGLHAEPKSLKNVLQASIDAVDAERYDAIVMGYGLCGKATEGLVARDLPIIIPRAHDCITLFLGSRRRYQYEFTEHTGTYWYSADYIERAGDLSVALSLGAETMSADLDAQYAEYVEKYGKENADYLMEVMGGWQAHYNRAAYIEMDFFNSPYAEQRAKDDAAKNNWTFDRVAGDLVLLKRLLDGDWEDDFLRLESGQTLRMANNEDVIRAD